MYTGVLVRLLDLMSRNRFEAINCFFHVVTPEEEAELGNDPLKKIRPLHDMIKTSCSEYYQPLQELFIDERMVKLKARSHFRQYILNKPTKWGLSFGSLLIQQVTPLTLMFIVESVEQSLYRYKDLQYDVVMELVPSIL